MSIQSFYLKEDANSCQGSHPHGEWCLSVTVSLSGPNPTVSRRDFVAGLFETPLNSREAAEQVARAINRARFGKTVCPACGGRLTFGGGCPDPRCSHVHDAVSGEDARLPQLCRIGRAAVELALSWPGSFAGR